MSDQRRSPRVQLELRVQVQFDTLGSVVQAKTVDVSREGLFLAMHPLRPVGTKVRFSLAVEDPPLRLELEGVVVRAQAAREQLGVAVPAMTSGVGVLLTRVPAEWERFCDALVDARLDAAIGE